MPCAARNAGSVATRMTSSARARRAASSTAASSRTVAPSGCRTGCWRTRPLSSMRTTSHVVAPCGISYSPAFRRRTAPRTAPTPIPPPALWPAPAPSRCLAMVSAPACEGISTTIARSRTAGAGMKTTAAPAAAAAAATRATRRRKRMICLRYTRRPGHGYPQFLKGVFMQELQLPTSHEWTVQDGLYGKLTIGSFEPGFALTVGNAYRRVLMSAIHGAAPTWVKIENVLHEFSHLPGVVEDTLDVMMNLRKVVFALHVNRPKILRLRAQGPTTVNARRFEPDADVEVLTGDVLLASLDKDGVLEMEVCIERGRGYVSAEKREPEALPINAILLDADFSPVKRVNIHVEPAGDRERLEIEVWTDGSATPAAPVGGGAAILEDHFGLPTPSPDG